MAHCAVSIVRTCRLRCPPFRALYEMPTDCACFFFYVARVSLIYPSSLLTLYIYSLFHTDSFRALYYSFTACASGDIGLRVLDTVEHRLLGRFTVFPCVSHEFSSCPGTRRQVHNPAWAYDVPSLLPWSKGSEAVPAPCSPETGSWPDFNSSVF